MPSANVRRASSVVCREQFALKDISSEATRPWALIFGMKHRLVDLNKFRSHCASEAQNGHGAWGLWFENEIYTGLKNLLQNCYA